MQYDTSAIRASFSRAATEYEAHTVLQREVLKHCTALAAQHFMPDAAVLDAGCGTGMLMEMLPPRCRWQVTGIDIAQGMCRAAASRREEVRVACGTFESMPFANASFDAVFSSLAIQWANQRQQLWNEFARVTKPDGRIVVSTLGPGTLRELRDAASAMDNRPHVHQFLLLADVQAQAEAAGWRIISAKQSARCEFVGDLPELLRSLHAIGAGNKISGRQRGLTTPGAFMRLRQAYDRQRGPRGLPVTWDIITIVAVR